MRNKYFILAVTFLCFLVGQNGWAQDYNPADPSFNLIDLLNDVQAAGGKIYYDVESYINDPVNDVYDVNNDGKIDVIDIRDLGGIQLDEAIVINNYHKMNPNQVPAALRDFNHTEYWIYNERTNSYIRDENPQLLQSSTYYYYDFDSDGYHSSVAQSPYHPGYHWSETTNGVDCDDKNQNLTTVCCPVGYVLVNDVCKPCFKLVKANVADHVYNTLNGIQVAGKTELNNFGNTHLVSPAGLPSEFNNFKWSDSNTGFSSALYSVDHGNGNIELIYATQGTNPLDLQDWVNNGQQALGYISAQYYQSVANANVLATWAANNGYTLSFTGHSLGGGLANANALATGLPATIYNPAGLSDGTVNDPNLNLNLNYSSNVTAFIVRGEPVDYLNTQLETPVRGTRNYIGSPQDTNSLYGTLSNLTILGLINTVQLHMMSSVISNIDCN